MQLMGTKILKINLITLLLLFFFSCNNVSNRVMSYKLISPCNEQKNSSSKDTDNYFVDFHCKECKKWSPPKKEQLFDVFKRMDTLLHRLEKNDFYLNIHNCRVEGKILIDNKEYGYHLNAAGWAVLANSKSEDQEIILGCNSEDCRKYFLSIRLTEAEREGEDN